MQQLPFDHPATDSSHHSPPHNPTHSAAVEKPRRGKKKKNAQKMKNTAGKNGCQNYNNTDMLNERCRRKEERSKQGLINNKAKSHSTPTCTLHT